MSFSISDVLKDRANRLAIEIGAAFLVVAVLLMPRCRQDPPTLPPKVSAAVVKHEIQTVVDSVETHQLRLEASRAKARADSADSSAERSRRTAKAFAAAADSLAAQAVIDRTAADSAKHWQQAYVKRTAERDTLVKEVDSLKAARVETTVALVKTASVAKIDSTGRRSADSLATALVGVVSKRSATSCRVAWFIPCPSRTQVAVGALIVGAVATHVIEHGGIGFSVKLP